jgi:hypothetical protein
MNKIFELKLGWFVLMIVISPLLQLLTTVFSFYMSLIIIKRKVTPPDEPAAK